MSKLGNEGQNGHFGNLIKLEKDKKMNSVVFKKAKT